MSGRADRTRADRNAPRATARVSLIAAAPDVDLDPARWSGADLAGLLRELVPDPAAPVLGPAAHAVLARAGDLAGLRDCWSTTPTTRTACGR
jgi:hypothetical protein